MIKAYVYLLSLIFLLSGMGTGMAQKLMISQDHRHIVYADGRPFFYLGDTAWELFHRLNREEADLYLENRAEKGFTVIQAVVLAELDGLKTPNAYGDKPLVDLDPEHPNEKYFQHVDYIVNKAQSLGMFIGMLPTWGDKWNKQWGVGPEIFTPENAYVYGKFLGKRYKDKPIIWILGGDRNPADDEDLAIIRAMARGLADGDGGTHLMTYHPMGGNSSSKFFHNDSWLSFDLFQSGHSERDLPNYEFTTSDRNLIPPKPTLDGEPRYEDHPVNWKPAENGWFNDDDARQAAYWSMMAGACGHTYGDHNIWQMWQEGRAPVSFARTNWRQALDYPGAFQVGYMKKFFETYPWQSMIPDQSVILNFNPRNGAYEEAMISPKNDLLFAYTPYGKTIKIDMDRLAPGKVSADWFNPRDGHYLPAGEFDTKGTREFTPHSMGRGSDWVLVLKSIK